MSMIGVYDDLMRFASNRRTSMIWTTLQVYYFVLSYPFICHVAMVKDTNDMMICSNAYLLLSKYLLS